MIRKLYLVESPSVDPYYNLALEECLLEKVEDACILYLWQNENTVVIGRNQNPWKECKTTLLAQEGGSLARRLSGGGAVYHDFGNLNFTFIMPQDDYDLDRQLTVIEKAVQSLGIHAERSGRNDVLACGQKFSGNAFYKNGKSAYHHGTLLVDANLDKLSRYLSPSKAKLQSKGVKSVRSRVVNLKMLNSQISIPVLKGALKESFEKVYGLDVEKTFILDPDRTQELADRNRSWEWNYGRKLPFSAEFEGQFPWGAVQICLELDHGIIKSAKVYTDAMDWTLAYSLEENLVGCRFDPDSLRWALKDQKHGEDLAELMMN